MNDSKYLENQKETMGENSFMQKLLKKRLNQKGLTLIELLAVIVILAIVAAIAIPAIGSLIENSRIKAAKSDAVLVLNAAKLYENDGNTIGTTAATVIGTSFEDYIDGIDNFSALELYKDGSTIKLNGTWTDSNVTVTFTASDLSTIDPSNANDETTVATPN